jgi:hypothetical protein
VSHFPLYLNLTLSIMVYHIYNTIEKCPHASLLNGFVTFGSCVLCMKPVVSVTNVDRFHMLCTVHLWRMRDVAAVG